MIVLSATIGYSGSFSLDWLGWLCPVLPIAVILAIVLVRRSSVAGAEASSAARLEIDLQQEIARSRASGFGPGWAAPTLPASVIASIWTHRFIATTTDQFAKSRGYVSTLAVNWNYKRAALYIVAVAIMSLRDQGLIRLSMEPPPRFVGTFDRVSIEPTDLARSSLNLPAIEGGLLSVSLGFAEKRSGQTDQPAASWVVRDWIGSTQSQPFTWVVEAAVQEGQAFGLYEPMSDQRGWRRRKPVYSIPHLAACEDQVVACVSRWREFGVSEPELQQLLLTEVGFGIHARQASGG